MYEKLNSVAGALELLRSAVKERGAGYIYQQDERNNNYNVDTEDGMGDPEDANEAWYDSIGCQYAVRDENKELAPACIVGVAIYTADGPGALAYVHDRYEGTAVVGLDIIESVGAREVLLAAQSAQDQGLTWGAALQAAEERAQELVGLQEAAVEE